MSRHNRRRRRARHSRHNDNTNWDSTSSSGSDSISSTGSLPSGYGPKPVNYSVFWHAINGATPWSLHAPADNGLEYLYRRGLPIQPGLTSSQQHNNIHRSDGGMGRWHHNSPVAESDQECETMCQGMANVVEFLFDGSTDYDDDKIDQRYSRPVMNAHPLSKINYSSFGVII